MTRKYFSASFITTLQYFAERNFCFTRLHFFGVSKLSKERGVALEVSSGRLSNELNVSPNVVYIRRGMCPLCLRVEDDIYTVFEQGRW
jgi:hypothetical protein